MVKLIIDNQEAALGDYSFDIIRENPLLTRAGDYTLDIDLDLRSEANSKIFRNVKRFHAKLNSVSFDAVLMFNEKVLLRGKAVLLSIDGYVLKIQLVSNNSELNYIYNNDKKIRDLNFGWVETWDKEKAAKVSNGLYGDTIEGMQVREAYPQMFKADFSDFGENVGIFNYNEGGGGAGSATYIRFDDNAELRPQPYLLYYIDKLVELLGYRMGQCDIDREKYKRLIIVHGYCTGEYSKLLPDWTVTEFISEIEKFFNVVFYLNKLEGTIDIISVSKFYKEVGTVYIDKDKVVDEHEIDYGEEASSIQTSYENVGYKLPSSEYWRFASLDEKFYEIAEKRELDTSHYRDGYDKNNYQVFYDRECDCEWVHYEDSNGENHYGRFVNQFKPYVTNKYVDRTELKIIPAKILSSYRVGSHGGFTFIAPIPATYENNQGAMCNAIRNGIEQSAGDVLQVAFYLGFCQFDNLSYGATMCYTTIWQELFNSKFSVRRYGISEINDKVTLSLAGRNGRCTTELKNEVSLDTTVKYVMKFKFDGWVDPRSKFVIDNRDFFCSKLKYIFENDGIYCLVEGEFYPALEYVEQEVEPDPIIDPVTDDAASTYAALDATESEANVFFTKQSTSLLIILRGTNATLSKSSILVGNNGNNTADIAGTIPEPGGQWEQVRVIKFVNGVKQYDDSDSYVGGHYRFNTKSFYLDINEGGNIYIDRLNVGDVYDYIMVMVTSLGETYKGRVRYTIVE